MPPEAAPPVLGKSDARRPLPRCRAGHTESSKLTFHHCGFSPRRAARDLSHSPWHRRRARWTLVISSWHERATACTLSSFQPQLARLRQEHRYNSPSKALLLARSALPRSDLRFLPPCILVPVFSSRPSGAVGRLVCCLVFPAPSSTVQPTRDAIQHPKFFPFGRASPCKPSFGSPPASHFKS